MIIINNFKELNFQVNNWKKAHKKIGFVPTMGALHEGHASLLEYSKSSTQRTVCSIFVNPFQFNNLEDYKKYPVTPEKDIALLKKLDCDLLFLPSEKEVYPDDSSKQKHYELGYLENILEGKFRPGHFQGVCLVMERLLKLVNPDVLFLGQKDYQQCLVIEKLIQLEKLEIAVVRCPTLREENGLAKSSRNLRLSKNELTIASELYKKLQYIKANLFDKQLSDILEEAIDDLSKPGFKVEYIELAKAGNLEIVDNYNPNIKHVLLIAAYLNGIRLIDNVEV